MSLVLRGVRSKRSNQAGSVLVTAALALSVIIVALIGTELGYLFYLKRELQKTADLAALAGARTVTPTTDCAPERQAATTNANDPATGNMPTGFSLADADVECGTWVPNADTTSDAECFEGSNDHFAAATGAASQVNAVRVRIRRDGVALLPFFEGSRRICVQAVAASEAPSAAFSVGSKLIDTNAAAPLMSLLRVVGVDASGTCIACYTGLAGVKITPSGLLHELGIPVETDLTVGALNALLAAQKVSVGRVLNAIATVAGQAEFVGVNADLVNSLVPINANVDDILVQLGTDPTQNGGRRGLFAEIVAPTATSALATQIDALDLLTAAVGVGVSHHAVELGSSADPLGLTTLQASIVEPPSIGIGGVGTTAYNAQVRVHAVIDTNDALGGILGMLGTSIHLPMVIDVVNAEGELTDINCDASPPEATIKVDAPILSACIGDISPSVLWSKVDACQPDDLGSMTFVRLLGMDLLKGKVHLDALQHTDDVTLSVGTTESTNRNPLAIGTTVSDLLSDLLKLLLGSEGSSEGQPADRVPAPELAVQLADRYLQQAGPTNINAIKTLLQSEGMDWARPGALLGLFSTTMPQEWAATVDQLPLLGGCKPLLSGHDAACVRNRLIESLRSPNQPGLVGSLLGFVAGVLGLNPEEGDTPLLAAVLGPIVALLSPILDTVGSRVSDLLGDTLGLELGRTDVHLQSVSCRNSKLVY